MATTLDRPVQSRHPPVRRASAGTILKRVLLGVVGFLALLVIVIALLPESVWKSIIVYVVSQQTHREAAIDGHLKMHLFSWNPRVTVDGFRLANADWKKDRPMLTVQHIDITVSLASLLKFSLVFPRIEIAGPDVDLERLADNRANWDFSTPGAKTPKKPRHGARHPFPGRAAADSERRQARRERSRQEAQLQRYRGGRGEADRQAGLEWRGRPQCQGQGLP